MPTSAEITKLRKSGQLDAAYELAQNLLADEGNNIWVKRAASWVLFDYLKIALEDGDHAMFIDNLKAIQHLELGKEEDVLYDNLLWKIGSYLFGIAKIGNLDHLALQALRISHAFHFTKPSKGYSFLLASINKSLVAHGGYIKILLWWGLDNLTEEDAVGDIFKGKEMTSLTESTYNKYAKTVLNQKPGNQAQLTELADRLEKTVELYPSMTFLPYFLAKAKIALGDPKDAMSALLPFAKKKSGEYWVWQLMAELQTESHDLRTACYARALLCNAPAQFLANVRQSLAQHLADRREYSYAKLEVLLAVEAREAQGWPQPKSLKALVDSDWYDITEANTNNFEVYEHWAPVADALLFANLPKHTAVINHVNLHKSMFGYVVSKDITGGCPWSKLDVKPEVGLPISIQLQEFEGNQGPYMSVATAEPLAGYEGDLIKKFNGTVRRKEGQAFAFIGDMFCPPEFVDQHILYDGLTICGEAVLNFHKKKNMWQYSPFSIDRK